MVSSWVCLLGYLSPIGKLCCCLVLAGAQIGGYGAFTPRAKVSADIRAIFNGIRPANYISRVDKRYDIVGGCVTRSLSNTTRVLPGRKRLPNRALYCTRAVRRRTHAVGVNSAADFTPLRPGRVSW